jgi:cation diffusion facilitator family transporter
VHTHSVERWLHDHTFGQEVKRPGEKKTLIVIGITAVTMAVEIAAGIAFGSMALLADGLHMASHASALTVSAVAYLYTRRHARDARFNFGTGKVNSLAAFASAVMLILFSLVMAVESVQRLVSPVAISFDQAIIVAVVGLVVNGISLLILAERTHSHDDHAGEHDHDHDDGAPPRAHEHGSPEHHDHNLLAAYLHVLADAVTSVLAIAALLSGKYLGQAWLDPLMGIVGAALIVRWSWSLIGISARVLLDMQAPEHIREAVRSAVESDGDTRVTDLHVWAVGPAIYAAEVAVVSSTPKEPAQYCARLQRGLPLVHVTVQTYCCGADAEHCGLPQPGPPHS